MRLLILLLWLGRGQGKQNNKQDQQVPTLWMAMYAQ
jgi:hypothetical protein